MGLKITKFKTDEAVEIAGQWVPIGEGAELKVARAGNKRAREISAGLRAPYRQQARFGKLDDDLERELLARAMAKAILRDWRGLLDADGEEIPYSEDAAFELLHDMPDFLHLVLRISAAEAEAWQATKEEDADTLGNASGGKPNGAASSKGSASSKPKA